MKRQGMLDLYTDYLISGVHYRTATGMSEALDGLVSHDSVTRFLSGAEYTSRDLWREVKGYVRKFEQEDGVLIFDDTLEEKPYTDENELVSWHFDHSKGRNVKGMNILSALVHYDEIALPVAFEVVKKDKKELDVKTDKERRFASRTKNEMFRDMVTTCSRNNLKYRYVLADIWYGSKENMEHVLVHGRHFVFPVKGNRMAALSKEEKHLGNFKQVESLELNEGVVVQVYIKGLDFPVSLTKQVFKNKDGSTGTLYLTTSDLSLDASSVTAIYKKRWKVEEYHKSIKSNVGLAKSPTKTMRTQANHIFATLCAFVKLELLKIKTAMNHFALKYKILTKASMTALAELQKLQTA